MVIPRAFPQPIRRWVAFNLVGLAGIGVQVASLAFLTSSLGLPLVAGTLLAVEAAILHNFAWHVHWTWRDRPAGRMLPRLARFHAANGAVSLAGNLALTWWLATAAGLQAVPANLLAIGACSLVNFALGDRWVFAAASTRPPVTRRSCPDSSGRRDRVPA